MFIQNSMTPGPKTIGPDMLVGRAIELLKEYDFRHLPVVDEENRLVGVVTDRDLRSAGPSTVLRGEERERVLEQVRETRIREIMSTDFVTLQPESTLDDALFLFQTRSIGAIPVVNRSGRIMGILSLNDLMAAWSRLFGLGEMGSVLMAIEDEGDPGAPGRIVQLLAEHEITFTRLIRTRGQGGKPAMLYVRLNTMNIRSVHRIVQEAGFTVHIPTVE
ncbi:MAG TPA: CBS domain-containing protein [Desulfobulbus sp.]|nr:CBS domain-containing protein [Desulfobulbus sp.]